MSVAYVIATAIYCTVLYFQSKRLQAQDIIDRPRDYPNNPIIDNPIDSDDPDYDPN